MDTWWQTETGMILITPLPGAIPAKPGSGTLPFPGIAVDVVNKKGESAAPNQGGYLVIKKPWLRDALGRSTVIRNVTKTVLE